MNKPLRRILGLAALALVAWLALENPSLLEPPAGSPSAGAGTPAADREGSPRRQAGGSAPRVRDVVVRDLDGSVAWRGDIELGPEIARIERGERDPHRNDGGVFGNREGLLPKRPRGYYREFVVRTPGIGHAGPQRLVVGRDGDAWYTPDHYNSFVRLEVEVDPP